MLRPRTIRSERIERLGRPGETGTFVFASDEMFGPYTPPGGPIAAPDGPLGTLYAGKLIERRPGAWQFIGFRGNGDRDFLGELIDPLPVTVEPEGQLLVEYPPIPPERTLTLAPEIQSLLDWGATVVETHGVAAAARAPPGDPGRARPRAPTPGRRGRPGRRSTAEERIAVDGGEIRVRIFMPAGAGPASRVRPLPRRRLRPRHDRLARQRREMRTHLPRRRVRGRNRRVPARTRASLPDRSRRLLRGARAGRSTNAERLGIDPTRVAVGGESAGGNLAAAVALMARDRGGPPLALQLLEVPVTDISAGAADHPSVALFGEGYGLDRADMEFYANEYLADPADGSSPYASPLLADDLTGVAPAHVITAEYDMLRDSGEAYARRLEEAGVETTLHRMLGHNHGSSVLWQTLGTGARMDGRGRRALRQAFA